MNSKRKEVVLMKQQLQTVRDTTQWRRDAVQQLEKQLTIEKRKEGLEAQAKVRQIRLQIQTHMDQLLASSDKCILICGFVDSKNATMKNLIRMIAFGGEEIESVVESVMRCRSK